MPHSSCIICGQDRFGAQKSNVTCAPWRTKTAAAPCPNCIQTKTLDEHIEETRAYLRHLEAHRAALRPGANTFHDPFITHFPTELASKILSFCVEDEREFKRRTPLTLSAVSKRWRAIAHSTPSLWTTIRLRLLFDAQENQALYKEMLLHWLSCSSMELLSIYLDVEYCRRDEVSKVQFCHSVIELLNTHCHRWGKLSVDTPLHLISLLRGDFDGAPPLYYLSIGGEEYDEGEDEDEDTQTWTFDLGTSLPSPHTVSIHQRGFGKVRINWRNVTTASIWFTRLHDFLILLAAAPQLRECRIVLPDEFDETTELNPTDLITHRNLLKLDIEVYSLSYQRAELFDILRAVPTLERLGITGASIFDNFFELLAADEGDIEERRFLPSLTEFCQLRPLWADSFSWREISKAVEARADVYRAKCGLPVLNRFYWDTIFHETEGMYYIDERSLQIFERLLSNGADIKLSNNWRKRGRPDDMIVYSRAYHEGNKRRSARSDVSDLYPFDPFLT
ncbi:hypothetical protein NLJ89_g7390 [Agrocybe chaxingu]|uniref:F-box domain-containing protein n=1 Tax=Agrocybe chaxingu TaxID=84603 RepID=A0A9W8JXG5_9AGAR|nr:hypothetical protein NLJ89_g7390 [Agrocybe chaxingu]